MILDIENIIGDVTTEEIDKENKKFLKRCADLGFIEKENVKIDVEVFI